jgi:hypothetical protein
MIELAVLFFIGCVIVILALSFSFRKQNREIGCWQFAEIELRNFVELRALSFKNFSVLFSDSDCRILRAEPRLVRIAKRIRIDRRRMALTWLAAVRSDVLLLWRLRRLLTAYGVSQGPVVETATTASIVSILAFISILRVCVFLFGPFAFGQTAYMARRHIETYSRSCRAALGRLPKNKLAEFGAEWRGQHVSAA